NRGCAVVAVIGATLVVIVLAALGGWYVLSRDMPESGDFEAAPGCTDMENTVLDELVPQHSLEIEEQIGTDQDTFGTGWQCRWATPEGPGEVVPAFASFAMVAAPNPGGVETAAQNFRETVEQHDSQELQNVGDEAALWVEEGPFTIACVGTRVSNLYLESCYSAAADYQAARSADEADILAGVEEITRGFVNSPAPCVVRRRSRPSVSFPHPAPKTRTLVRGTGSPNGVEEGGQGRGNARGEGTVGIQARCGPRGVLVFAKAV